MSLKDEIKEIKEIIYKLKLDDMQALATYILNFNDWLVKMAKYKPEYKWVLKRLHTTIPEDFISFDERSKIY